MLKYKYKKYTPLISIKLTKKSITISNALQLRSQPEELQVKLNTLIANVCNSGHSSPKEYHQSAITK